MKIVLFNVPGGSHYEGPIMGIPALVGQLKTKGYEDTFQRDLDLELFYHCLEPDLLSFDFGGLQPLRRALLRVCDQPVKLGLAGRSLTPLAQMLPEPHERHADRKTHEHAEREIRRAGCNVTADANECEQGKLLRQHDFIR